VLNSGNFSLVLNEVVTSVKKGIHNVLNLSRDFTLKARGLSGGFTGAYYNS
jgi:hypothetical protein